MFACPETKKPALGYAPLLPNGLLTDICRGDRHGVTVYGVREECGLRLKW